MHSLNVVSNFHFQMQLAHPQPVRHPQMCRRVNHQSQAHRGKFHIRCICRGCRFRCTTTCRQCRPRLIHTQQCQLVAFSKAFPIRINLISLKDHHKVSGVEAWKNLINLSKFPHRCLQLRNLSWQLRPPDPTRWLPGCVPTEPSKPPGPEQTLRLLKESISCISTIFTQSSDETCTGFRFSCFC